MYPNGKYDYSFREKKTTVAKWQRDFLKNVNNLITLSSDKCCHAHKSFVYGFMTDALQCINLLGSFLDGTKETTLEEFV